MEKIKRYIDCHVPITTCNLRCPYCYVYLTGKFKAKIPEFKYSPSQVRRALSKERLGGICMINFCAWGETLLAPEMLAYIKELLEEGHFISVVTNGTLSKRFDLIAKFPEEYRERLFFKFSYHYLQLKSKNLLDIFFKNVKKMRDAGCSFTIEVTPHDELIPFIEEMNTRCMWEVGAIPHFTVTRNERTKGFVLQTDLPREEYYKVWGAQKSSFFEFKKSIFEVPRKEFCYAGNWSFYLNLGTGNMYQCYNSNFKQNIFENPNRPIKFFPIGRHCQTPHCYNGHAWLAWGDIPELDTPTYGDIRNKCTVYGTEWLQPKMKEFMSHKLKENNEEYSKFKQHLVNVQNLALVSLKKLLNIGRSIKFKK